MTKTLTEQWKDGELDEGWYYVVREWEDEIHMLYFEGDYFLDTDVPLDNDNIKEVLAPVPSYDEYIELIKKTEQLEKKLEIATKALKEFRVLEYNYLDYSIDKDGNKIDLHPNRVATKALKEMEGVK